jgi:hypothetical protein
MKKKTAEENVTSKEVNSENKNSEETVASGKNKLRDLIVKSIEMSRISKIPVLFISNPGYGKTSTIQQYAEVNGYHVESLIGSRFSPEEILGYQVNNGGESLEVLQPEWYGRIMAKEKEGIPSILFLDEISTAPDAVQGSLLQLVFERAIGNGKKLPEDCIVLSAANYKSNLPAMFNIMAPTLNRFDIVNLNMEVKKDSAAKSDIGDLITPLDMVYEFTQTEEERKANFPHFDSANILSEEERKNCLDVSRTFFEAVLSNYADKENSKGFIDVTNTDIEDIYDVTGQVYNFISGRTISYTERMLQAVVEMGLDNSDPAIRIFLNGLIGLGSNSFSKPEQMYAYQTQAYKLFIRAIDSVKHNRALGKSPTLDYSKDSLTDAIKRWETYYEKSSCTAVDNNLPNLFNKVIKPDFDKKKENLNKLLETLEKDETAKANFFADKKAIEGLLETTKKIQSNVKNDTITAIVNQLSYLIAWYDLIRQKLLSK